MIGIGIWEMVILGVVGLMCVGIPLVVVLVAVASRSSSQSPPPPQFLPPQSLPPSGTSDQTPRP